MATLRFRMFGSDNQLGTLMALLHGMDEVDRVEEVADQMHGMRDDSSSADLPDDAGLDFHDVEARTRSRSVERVRHLVERTAGDIDAMVEFVDRF